MPIQVDPVLLQLVNLLKGSDSTELEGLEREFESLAQEHPSLMRLAMAAVFGRNLSRGPVIGEMEGHGVPSGDNQVQDPETELLGGPEWDPTSTSTGGMTTENPNVGAGIPSNKDSGEHHDHQDEDEDEDDNTTAGKI